MSVLGLAYAIIYLIVFTFGITIGSFLNVLIYRIPRKLNYVTGRSMCPKCQTKLKALDLMPVLSYILLGGKCRYCKEPISPRYPLVELLGGVAAAASYHLFGMTLEAALVFVILAILIVITFIDIDFQEIPDGLNLTLFLIGVLMLILQIGPGFKSAAFGFFIVSGIMLAITLLISGAFGGGDIKLCAAMGTVLGGSGIVLGSFIGIIFGGIYGAYLLLTKKKDRKDHFAFGPFLAIGMAAALLYQEEIISWYLGLFGL